MNFVQHYTSPIGALLLAANKSGLNGVWFEGQKHFAAGLGCCEERETEVLAETKHWLDDYFSGKLPDFMPPLCPKGTAFQQAVWQLLREIPRGEVTTYGALARQLAQQQGRSHLSAQAVGGAVGRNPISILVPCHRVVGADGSLTGYAGGIEKKAALLTLEGVRLETGQHYKKI